MKHIYIFVFVCALILNSSQAYTQTGFSVYLIGDAGENTSTGEALLLLKSELISNPSSAVVFLGDNVYPSGLRKSDPSSVAHLESQLSILNNYMGQVYFIPGNHDWSAQRTSGWKRIKNQETYVSNYLKTKSSVSNKNKLTFLPSDGLPGPVSVLLDNKLRLIIIDTQWFLQRHKKNIIGTKRNTEKIFYSQLESMLNEASLNHEQVIITAHHPMYTNGQHSRNKQPLRFLINRTPFCFIGFMGVFKLFSQDMAQPRYKHMRNSMLQIFNQNNNIVFASGHEHNVQCIMGGENRYVVSGNGSKLSKLRKKKKFDSVFQDDTKTGFIKINYSSNGDHHTTIFRVGEDQKVLDGF